MQGRDTSVVTHDTEKSGSRKSAGLTVAMFGLSRDSHMRHVQDANQPEKQGPIDEVQALKGIFYTFFNANAKAQKSQKDVLVSMTTHETSINPFHAPDCTVSNLPNNVAEAEENDD